MWYNKCWKKSTKAFAKVSFLRQVGQTYKSTSIFWGSNTSFKWNYKLLDKIFHCPCFSKLKDGHFRATASNGSSKFLTVLIRCPLWLIELLGDCWPTPHPKLSTRKIRQICRRPIKQIYQLRAQRLVPRISQTVFQTTSQTAIENVCWEIFRDGGTETKRPEVSI